MYQLETLSNFEMQQIRYFYKDSPDAVKHANEKFIVGWQIANGIIHANLLQFIKENKEF